MAFASITVTGTYKQADGVTASVGRVEFRLVNPGANTTDDEIIVPGEIVETLDGTGSFSTTVPTSSAVGGQSWQVVEVVDGYRRLYYVEIPDSGPVDLADLAPIGAADLSATYVLAAALTLSGLSDVDLTGLADGDTITYDSASGTWVATEPAAGGGGVGTDDQTAAEVPFTPAGSLAATDVQAALEEVDSEKAATGHNHDGTYSPTAHNHDADYSDIAHTHDTRYYTEAEVDTALSGKSDTGHDHSGVYSPTAHTHDDRYYTEAEADTALSGKADSGHNHDGTYQPLDPVLTATTASFTSADETKLDGIEAGATGDQTAADLRALGFFDTTNDGTGSGLDADLLDGQHASAFATSGHNHSGIYEPVDSDILRSDVADTLTVGFDATDHAAGTKSSGTFTPDPADGNFQTATNGGAHTLAPPVTSCSIIIHYTNNASAGAITTSGFTVVNGDALDTTDANEFILQVLKVNDVSTLTVTALQ